MGAGGELFAIPGKLSLEFDLEYLLAGANTTWTIGGEPIRKFEDFHPGGLMVLFGMNYYIN